MNMLIRPLSCRVLAATAILLAVDTASAWDCPTNCPTPHSVSFAGVSHKDAVTGHVDGFSASASPRKNKDHGVWNYDYELKADDVADIAVAYLNG